MDVIEKHWDLEFRGTKYTISMAVAVLILVVKLEDKETAERWSAEFTVKEIEEKTANTGSFINFDAFVKALSSALSEDDDNIVGNIITSSELQTIKARGKSGSNNGLASPAHCEGTAEKRYVIATFIGGNKPVHYSLTLDPDDTDAADVAALRRTIACLRDKVAAKDKENYDLVNAHKELHKQVEILKGKLEHGVDANTTRVISDLRGQLAKAQKELSMEREGRGANSTSHRIWHRTNNQRDSYRCRSADRARSCSPAHGRDVRDNFGLSRGDWRKAPDRDSPITGQRIASPNLSRPSYAGPRSREVSPSLRVRGGTPTYTHNTFSNTSPARRGASTSLGGRFDPTAYQREKASRECRFQHDKAWGAGSAGYRSASPSQEDSGYISANSQSSDGSRRSQRSDSTKGSQGSHQSDTRKKKTSKKKSSTTPSPSNRWAEEPAQTKKSAPAPKSGNRVSAGVAAQVLSIVSKAAIECTEEKLFR